MFMRIRPIIITLALAALSPTVLRSDTQRLQNYTTWITEEFDGLELPTALQEASADPDHDGLSNLLEYALDSDPLYPSLDDMPSTRIQGDQMAFSFVQDLSKTDITYHLQSSSDLVRWENMETNLLTSKGTLEQRQGTLSLSADNAPRFLRMVIRQKALD